MQGIHLNKKHSCFKKIKNLSEHTKNVFGIHTYKIIRKRDVVQPNFLVPLTTTYYEVSSQVNKLALTYICSSKIGEPSFWPSASRYIKLKVKTNREIRSTPILSFILFEYRFYPNFIQKLLLIKFYPDFLLISFAKIIKCIFFNVL